MTDEQKAKAKNGIMAAVPYISAVVLAIAILGMLYFSGKMSVEASIAVLVAVGALFGLRKVDGDITTKAGAVLLMMMGIAATGCGAACQTERTVVDALGAGIVAADVVVGDQGGEDYDTASMIAIGAHELGKAAVDACELLRDGEGWQSWVALALEAARGVAAMIDGAGPADVREPVPQELAHAIELLEAEAQ